MFPGLVKQEAKRSSRCDGGVGSNRLQLVEQGERKASKCDSTLEKLGWKKLVKRRHAM